VKTVALWLGGGMPVFVHRAPTIHCERAGLFIQMMMFTHAIKGAFISLPGDLPSCFKPHVLNLMWGVADDGSHYSKL
jgi:hypothetical protein